MPQLRKPRPLRRGAVLGVAAPGSPVDPERLEAGEAWLLAEGFRVKRRPDLLASDGYLAGDDTRRAAELMELISDPQVDGIICARGGYGCDRLLTSLDASVFRSAAKPLVGYSDVTALLLWQLRCAGLVGFHGPMLDRGADLASDAIRHLIALLTGDAPLPAVMQGRPGVGGCATGRLVGGSLTLLAASVGSAWEPDTRGAILLLEDVSEAPYRVDRMLQQLRSAGKFEGLAAVGVGSFQDCADERYPQPSVATVIAEAFRPLGIPFVTELPFGHIGGNYAWPMGGRATIDAESGELRLLERGVAES